MPQEPTVKALLGDLIDSIGDLSLKIDLALARLDGKAEVAAQLAVADKLEQTKWTRAWTWTTENVLTTANLSKAGMAISGGIVSLGGWEGLPRVMAWLSTLLEHR